MMKIEGYIETLDGEKIKVFCQVSLSGSCVWLRKSGELGDLRKIESAELQSYPKLIAKIKNGWKVDI